ncbi:MAG: DUF1624 domain-containing protein [Ignavibacteriales bacterium]|nr:MAG: DUF1624 domain-containing protein [Ignavibacteriales bacterium]
MTIKSKKNRIIFIDLMRAFAVLMMVQGHTVDVLLSNDFRNMDSPFFLSWFFMRGMTAPIFLFTSGTVFTYLFRLVNEPFLNNPRTKKGFKRVLLLIVLGYLLRYPTPTLVVFNNVTPLQWQIFFAVDVLQLIGFGLFFILILMFLSEKLKLNDYITFALGALFFFVLYPIFDKMNWSEILPAPLAGYFYKGTGSNFPLFPWAGYVICGAILGSFLAKNPDVFRSTNFSFGLIIAGIIILSVALIGDRIETASLGKSYLWTTSPNLVILRLAIVLFLNGIVSLIASRVDKIPRIIILLGRNTLLIYIVHLMILYGSAWNPGIILLFNKSFGVLNTIGSALLMLSTMTLMVIILHRLKIKNKQLVT